MHIHELPACIGVYGSAYMNICYAPAVDLQWRFSKSLAVDANMPNHAKHTRDKLKNSTADIGIISVHVEYLE